MDCLSEFVKIRANSCRFVFRISSGMLEKTMVQTYDVHTHIGLDTGFYLRGWWPYASTAADLIAQMDAHGIDRAVCFPFTLASAFDAYAFSDRNEVNLLPGRFPFDRENALLAMEIERVGGGRLLQFAMFDPARAIAQQVTAIKPLIGKIAGLKTQSTVIRSPVRALIAEGRQLMELAMQHNLPVLFHTSVNDPWAQVSDCLAVAREFPKIRFNLAHSCRFHEPLLRECAQTPNVWVDCSAHLAHCYLARENIPAVALPEHRVRADYSKPADAMQAVHAILGDKYMWGSDNPFMSWCDDKLRIIYTYEQEMNVVLELPDPIRRSMLTDAPQAWLGL
jgi:predicted TIM-barrel fold metal-dependent hydrolase